MKPVIKYFLFATMLVAGTMAEAATITPSSKYETRKVISDKFDAVRTNTAIDIYYTVGPQDIEIYAPENLLPYIKVSILGSEIRVGYTENMNIRGKHKAYVKISSPDVKKFTAASAGDVIIKSPIKQLDKTVELITLSAGDVKALDIQAKVVALRTNSAGDIDTKAITCGELSIIVNSAGDVETGNIVAKTIANVKTNSAGDIFIPELIAGTSASVKANSAGTIKINQLSAPDATIASNSAGNITVTNIKANNVSAYTGSVGKISLSGICSKASLAANCAGDVKASQLKALDVIANTNGNSNISCWAIKSLNAKQVGFTGEIRYKGDPVNLILESKNNRVKPL